MGDGMKNFGILLVLLGISLIGFAMYDFFTLDLWEEPKYFWMFFVGMPFIFIGLVLNGGRIQKAMLNQQKDNIRETMKVMGEGLNAGLKSEAAFCHEMWKWREKRRSILLKLWCYLKALVFYCIHFREWIK
jgi:hypothetical protein